MLLLDKRRVPGWGNAFVKGRPDPIWTPVEERLPIAQRAQIERVTLTLHAHGKLLFPNPSCFTAAVALTMRLPREITPYLLICGRLGTWTHEYARVRGLT
jgi:citrate synthase